MEAELVRSTPEITAEAARFMPVMSMAVALDRREILIQAMSKLLNEGIDSDYGVIPGTKKKTLLQPGAQKLDNLFGLVPRFIVEEKELDWTGERHNGEPFFYFEMRCQLWRGDFLMGEGLGSANSWESKYRYRNSERVCPKCGKDSIIRGKAEYGGGWVCFTKKGGCNAKFPDGSAAIEGQETGKKPNPDIADVVNTVMKISSKRSHVAATINATSASEFFSQDVEDQPGYGQAQSEPISRQQRQEDIGGQPQGVYEQPQAAPRKAQEPPAPKNNGSEKPAVSFEDRIKSFGQQKARIGAEAYYGVLGRNGFEHANQIKSVNQQRTVFKELLAEPAQAEHHGDMAQDILNQGDAYEAEPQGVA